MIAPEDIPDDVDGDVLRRMRARGDSLTQARAIAYSVVFPTEQAGRSFCEAIAEFDVETGVEKSDVNES